MRLRSLLKEAAASAWAAKIPALLVAVVAAAMCFAALFTVGANAANQAAVQSSLATAGARTLIVRDATGDQGFINNRTLAAVDALSTTQTSIAVGLAFDSVNGRIGNGGTLVTTWPVHGNLSAAVHLIAGRLPQPGEAIISTPAQTNLGLAEPVGFLSSGTTQYPIVGAFTSVAPFDDMATGAILNANNTATATELRVVIDSIADAPATQTAVLGILAPTDPTKVSLQSPRGLAALTDQVAAQLASHDQATLLLILAVGGLFVAAVVLSDVLVRRRDLGRRRTLGSTRSDLATLVTIRATIPATAGALVGAGAALIATSQTGYQPPLSFAAAIAVLAIITAAAAAIAPAAYAARVDPVKVMRTP